jgi:prepilin-type N-terminal cleavage/methylation domain-containing protein
MADPATHPSAPPRAAGFTLVEMIAALAILLFGVIGLFGAMTSSIGQRRSTDARHELCALCDLAVNRAVHECVKAPNGGVTPPELVFEPLVDEESPGFPGMRWSAHVVTDESRPELWMVKIDVRWYEAGDEVSAEFLRVVPRQLPLRDRVSAFRGDTADPEKR